MEPATRPPPNTRFSSLLGMSMRVSDSASISLTASARWRRPAGRLPLVPPVGDAGATRSSTSVFHAPQAGQRPSHFGASAPHSVQNHAVFTFFLAINYLF